MQVPSIASGAARLRRFRVAATYEFWREPGDLEPGYLEPGPDQRHVGGAGREQRNRKRELHAFVGGLVDRSHGPKHPAILAGESRGFFFPGFTTR
ncbi:hypothetical protein BE61_45560 [Bradyrhizobium elkanii USDA 61]|nr:hypothetical protein BE61_45560 [Bradyrhizobium elkanii USDA 61]GEC52685.1 hypothetical protein BEL01nite_17280 [Bradyrhizobium elkanii]